MEAEPKPTEHADTPGGNGGPPAQLPVRMNPEDLRNWLASVKCAQDCHFDTAATLNWYHYATGIPLVILSAVSASSLVTDAGVFASSAKPIASALGLLVTVLAAVQTFLGFEKRAGLHYKAGAQYGALKREIDLHPEICGGEWLLDLNTRWNALIEESPIIPLRTWRRQKRPPAAPPVSRGLRVPHRWRHAMSILLRGQLPSPQA